MNIRDLLRQARQRWPEPEDRGHHVMLNRPEPGQEDWLTLGVWAENQRWYFYITGQHRSPSLLLDFVEEHIRGTLKLEQDIVVRKAEESISLRPLTEPMKTILLKMVKKPDLWQDACDLRATGASLQGLALRGLLRRQRHYGGGDSSYALTPEGMVVALVLQKDAQHDLQPES